ncbi:hypothetical protein [Halalkalibacterium halodurans]|uniref:hypothetical protein n=1 Tax=Halalkalibacterium halodurans TaxID=86665 RepID=UPI002AAA01E6|nr:hypothetical protein [Halalkalibacterium halodurans]MDY7220699.1 hypothetical protein [Halalkalibacterium halodurans]MDY7239938.1 hypothetical protein [Halalkalibacterium halodurans]
MKWYRLLLISALLLIVIIAVAKTKVQLERVQVEGIEQFHLDLLTNEESDYLLFYPADIRVNQDATIVKAINENGEVVEEFEIVDDEFRRMLIHQKPTDMDTLYVSLFGEATSDNYYYTFDLQRLSFEKVELDYFSSNVGVQNLEHFGEEVLFDTAVSHKTGEQNIDPDTYAFNVSLSNATTEQSFETELDFVPKSAPLLGFQERIIYGLSGRLNQEGHYENAGIGIVDMAKENVTYEDFQQEGQDLYPLYANDDYAYILSEEGTLFVYDREFQYRATYPFHHLPRQDMYYLEGEGAVFLEENKAFYLVQSEEDGFTLGLLTFGEHPTFQALEKDYIQKDATYEILYYDHVVKEIYLREEGADAHLLIIDNGTFDVKAKIPIEDSHLLDFVLKVERSK